MIQKRLLYVIASLPACVAIVLLYFIFFTGMAPIYMAFAIPCGAGIFLSITAILAVRDVYS